MPDTALSRRPHQYARRVLFAVSGLSPQVITETVFALAMPAEVGTPAFVPTEIHALTTTEGAQRIRLALLSEQPGGFQRLCRDYALSSVRFDEQTVHVVCDAHGQPLADIRSDADNARMADAITELVRQFTADPDCALHVSLAGGRKTMGYYAGYALSLFGREQDQLSHVLVSPPFETHPEFYYPTPQTQVLPLRDGGWADASQAQVSLARIPFVRLRAGLPRALLEGRTGFANTVEAANAGLGPSTLELDIAHRRIRADGITIDLPPMQFSLLALLAQRARTGKPALRAPHRDVHDAPWALEALSDLRQALGEMHLPDGIEDSLLADCSGTKVSPHLSRLRKVLRQRLAPGRDQHYFDDGGAQRHKRYRVPLGAQAIHFIAPAR